LYILIYDIKLNMPNNALENQPRTSLAKMSLKYKIPVMKNNNKTGNPVLKSKQDLIHDIKSKQRLNIIRANYAAKAAREREQNGGLLLTKPPTNELKVVTIVGNETTLRKTKSNSPRRSPMRKRSPLKRSPQRRRFSSPRRNNRKSRSPNNRRSRGSRGKRRSMSVGNKQNSPNRGNKQMPSSSVAYLVLDKVKSVKIKNNGGPTQAKLIKQIGYTW
jgi:hypothetical protein